MIDIHTHILANVDDGSKDLETSLKMIELEIAQGVTDIVLTPHIQSRVTRATKEEQVLAFNTLQDAVKQAHLDIRLHLAGEIHYRSHLDTNYDDYAFGKHKYILMEFPTRIETPIEEICYDLMHMGYQVIVAHTERYQYLSIDDIIKIKATGALIQTNASSILNLDKSVDKKTVKMMIKHKLIDVIATDTHNLDKRPPNLLQAKQYLSKYYDDKSLNLLFNRIELTTF
jgi:protein-tyrosine phosphatase